MVLKMREGFCFRKKRSVSCLLLVSVSLKLNTFALAKAKQPDCLLLFL